MIKASLIGNPNTGKTTLFNCLTGAHEHVGNWHGVTVEEKAKLYKFNDKDIEMVDLPGIYSLSSLSFEEEVAVKYVMNNPNRLVVNICDASNLQRNLYLTLGLLEFGADVILAVNQIDKKPICKIDYKKLSLSLGIPVIPINPESKAGIDNLNNEIINHKPREKKPLPYIKDLNLSSLESFTKSTYYAIKLLENDSPICEKFKSHEKEFKPLQTEGLKKVASARYGYIDNILSACCTKRIRVYGQSKIDKILLNRFLAFPIFVGFIALAFYLTFFSLGAWLSGIMTAGIEKFIGGPLVSLCESAFPGSWISSLVQVALVGGLGSIMDFLPQVALLFLFLSILEDSGYLSRVAFVFEDILSKVGLSGKSIYTLLMGFGCSTTAVLTARNMEDKNSKIKTGLLTPYMSCSAKFPIYAVLGGAFFGAKNIFVILGLYFLGVFVAIALSYIFEKTILKSKEQTFILEFPPYHHMSAKRILGVLWSNVKLFIIRVGTLILAMNVIVWLLSNFSFTFNYIPSSGGQSMLETLGKFLAPIFIPLGFGNWGLVSALIAGLIAKEVIVSSIAMFNHVDGASEGMIQNSLTSSESVVFFAHPASVISYLVFCLLYFPCLATTAVLSKEIGKKWTFIGCIIQLLVAYLVTFIIYTLSRLAYQIGFWKLLLIILAFLVILISFIVVYKKIKYKKTCSYCTNCRGKCKK